MKINNVLMQYFKKSKIYDKQNIKILIKTRLITMLGQASIGPKGKINNTGPVIMNNYEKSVFIEFCVQGIVMCKIYMYIFFMRYK